MFIYLHFSRTEKVFKKEINGKKEMDIVEIFKRTIDRRKTLGK